METKICKKCLNEKNLDLFNKGNDPKDGRKYICKECQKIINKEYNDNNKENYKKWVLSNPEKIKNRAKRQYEKNKNKPLTETEKIKIKEAKARYYIKNKEKILKTVKNYSDKNKEKISKRQETYRKIGKTKEYRNKNKHIVSWRNCLNNTLKRLGKPKEGKTIDLLGYSALELKQYIESLFTEGMSWDNYGEWHIDHIKDVVLFDDDTPPCVVNALTNLRPLWATTRKINGVVYEGNLNRKKSFKPKK